MFIDPAGLFGGSSNRVAMLDYLGISSLSGSLTTPFSIIHPFITLVCLPLDILRVNSIVAFIHVASSSVIHRKIIC